LIDEGARKAQKIQDNMQRSIVIFDEAHNLESSCNESTSFTITPHDWTLALQEAKMCLDKASQIGYLGDVAATDINVIMAVLQDVQKAINQEPLREKKSIRDGDYIFDVFGKAKINQGSAQQFTALLEQLIALHTDITQRGSKTSKSALSIVLQAVKTCFKEEWQGLEPAMLKRRMAPFRVYISEESSEVWTNGRRQLVSGRSLSLWCFSSGVAMRNLTNIGVRCVILASGTLSPLDSFAGEMGMYVYAIEC